MTSQLKVDRISPANGSEIIIDGLDITSNDAACRVLLEGTQLAPKNVIGKINMDVVDFDTKGWWDNVNLRYIPQESGYYLVIVKLSLQDSTQDNGQHAIIAKNGVMISGSYRTNQAGAMHTSYSQDIVYCNGTSDYLEPYGENESNDGSWTNTCPFNEGDNAYISIAKVAS